MIRSMCPLAMSDAMFKFNRLDPSRPALNNLTIRGIELPEELRMRRLSSDMNHAGIKALRLYRRICRLLPFILRIHDLNYKVTPIQAKIRVGNHFRDNAILLNTHQADKLIQKGYEVTMQSQWHHLQQTYLYKYLAPPDTHLDQGRNNISKRWDSKSHESSKFLKSFYTGKKSHVV